MATVNLGKIKLKWRGTYAGGTAYTPDDVVEYTDGSVTSSYICVTASTGNAPSSGGSVHSSWNYMAKGQATSPTTTQGDIIVRGASADGRLAIGSAGQALKVNSSGNGLEYGTGMDTQRVAGAWVNFNADGTAAARDSYNVSSMTDHGQGQQTVNFTTACANTNYCVVGGTSTYASGTNDHHMSLGSRTGGFNDGAMNTGSCKIWTLYDDNNGQQDCRVNCVAFFGDWS